MVGKGGQVQKEGFEVKGSDVTQALRLRKELCGRWRWQLLGTGYRLLEALFLC